jgi:hypothetical protein
MVTVWTLELWEVSMGSHLDRAGSMKEQRVERELTFRIVLEKPPDGVDFALQKGKGSKYEIVQRQRSGSGDLQFEFTARGAAPEQGEAPNLLGPFVQGPPDGRFVYIGIGMFAGQTATEWSRRLKVPLSGISAEMVGQAVGDSHAVFETRVPGTGKDGGPNCATVKPFAGWKLVKR